MIQTIIRNEMEGIHRDITNSQLADAIGVDKSLISKFFNDGTEISFCHIFKAVRFLNPSKEKEIMSKICRLLQREENKRASLEYASTNRDMVLFKSLLNDFSKSSTINRDWSRAYEVVYEFQKREKTDKEILNLVHRCSPKQVESKIVVRLTEAMVLYKMHEYSYMITVANIVHELIPQVKNEYLKQSYLMRANELLASVHLHLNETGLARNYANKIISANLGAKFVADAYYTIGTSFLYEDFSKCIKYLTICANMYEEQKRFDLVNIIRHSNIKFAQIHWGINIENFDSEDASEHAHYEAKWGDKEKAIELLDSLLIGQDAKSESNFRKYYRGLASNNNELLLESFFGFIDNSDKLYAMLPLTAMEGTPHHRMAMIAIGSLKKT
jgi:transcriptional regulator with XRE-family HTH domain